MLQDDDYKSLRDMVTNYSARDILKALYKIYGREADDLADIGYKEKSAAYADISDSLEALHDVCDPSW